MKSRRSNKSEARAREIFLSHSSRDRKLARRVATVLRQHGLPVWYSETNIVGAQQWHDEIGRALERCDWFLLILSPDSVKSQWVKRELLYALQQPRYAKRIVPVLMRRCAISALSWTLPGFQIIDFTDDVSHGYQELLRVWGIGYDPDRC